MSEQFWQQERQYITKAFYGTWIWLEVFVISLLAAALGFVFHPEDPLWVNSGFPWIWIASVLLALRYGVFPGVVSSLLILAVWLLLERHGASHFPKEYFLGGVLLVMLSGQFNIIWESRLMRAKQVNEYIDERLAQLTHQHHILILSHQNLEQEFFSKPVTFRDAIIRLNVLLNDEPSMTGAAEQSLLKLLTQYCQLESAAFFVAEAGGYKKICEIGTPPPLESHDPLLQYALSQKTLAHLAMQELDEKEVRLSPFLIVSPMFLESGELLGVLAVERLPLFALTTETLQMIAVILEYYADSRNSSASTFKLRETFPNIPVDFAQQLVKMLHLQGKFGIESHIVVISLPRNETSLLAAGRLESVRRALDVGWIVLREREVLILNLLPLSNQISVAGYFSRIEFWFNEYFPSLKFGLRVMGLASKTLLLDLQELLCERSDA